MTPKTINQYAKDIYTQNVARGWWDDPDRDVFQALQLVNTEIAEATEGDRKNLDDDHLPHRRMVEVELADALIRLLDLAGKLGWRYVETCPSPMVGNAKTLAAQHLWLTVTVGDLAVAMLLDAAGSRCKAIASDYFSRCVSTILELSRQEGYDLRGAIDEKLEYNRKRADHDRGNRAAEHGKKY